MNIYKQRLKEYVGRKMSIPRVIENLVHLKDKYDMNFFQIIDDNFLQRSEAEIKQFSALYKEKVGLPFWIQAEVNFVISSGVKLLPGIPPIVPRIPEIDLISVIKMLFG